jgi:phosphoglycerate dehydrogenase-like enzyme
VGSLEALLDAADVVSLHCPLTAETSRRIGVEAFRRMKSTATLINTARGQLMDVPALIAAIREGDIGDALPTEPPNPDDEVAVASRDLKAAGIADRFILTPHAAWASPESRADALCLAVETAILYLSKGHLRNLVNGPFLAAARR